VCIKYASRSLTKEIPVIIDNRIHGKTDSTRVARYRCGRNINSTSAIENLIFLPARKLNTAGPLLSYNQVVSSGEDGRAEGWNGRMSRGHGVKGGGKEEGKVEFIGLAFISSSKGNRILVWKAARRNLNSRK